MTAAPACFATAGHGLLPPIPPASLPPERRGRLRNGAAPGDFLAAPRCGARTRAGGRCRQPAMHNGRCRLHGGLSTGPRTAEGRARCATARRTHGFYSAEIVALRRAGAAYCRRMNALRAVLRARRTAGHGVHRSFSESRVGAATPGRSSVSSHGHLHGSAPTVEPTMGVHLRSPAVETPSSAGHGVLPSIFARALDTARPTSRPAPRPGLVQRTLLGGTALGLGLSIRPPVPAGHGVLPSFSRRAG